jgi:hypothetical protein
MRLPQHAVRAGPGVGHTPAGEARPYQGHAHFWERALSRRRFLGASAAVAGAVAGAELWLPAVEAADRGGMAPKPIPGGLPFNGKTVHVFLPGTGAELATIFDFDGAIGVANVDGAGTAVNTKTGERSRLLFDVGMRFMQGAYVGVNGHQHNATFGFV